jgi:hypothetical protein
MLLTFLLGIMDHGSCMRGLLQSIHPGNSYHTDHSSGERDPTLVLALRKRGSRDQRASGHARDARRFLFLLSTM